MIMSGSFIFLIYTNTSKLESAIRNAGMSLILLKAITNTEPISAPTTAAVIPSTKALTGFIFANLLKYGAGITVNK